MALSLASTSASVTAGAGTLAASLQDRGPELVAQTPARHREDVPACFAGGDFQIVVDGSEIVEPLAFGVDQNGGRRVGFEQRSLR